MVLTDKQRSGLHDAIFEYLTKQEGDYVEVARQFQQIAKVNENNNKKGGVPLLEKKWTSVVRLQRKVLELEQKVKDLENEKKSLGAGMVSSLPKGGNLRAGDTFLLKSTSSVVLRGHRAIITSVCFHPRFNLLVSTSDDATIKVWDFESGEFERTLKGHTNSINDAAFNVDGTLLASCSADLSIKIWTFSGNFECIKTLRGHDHNVTGVSFFQREKLVSCSRDETVKLWDTNSGYCLTTLTGHTEWVRKIAVHEASNLIASCSNDHTVRVWNPSNTSQPCVATFRGHEHVVECVAFSSQLGDRAILKATTDATSTGGGQHVVSGSRDRSIRIWHIASETCIKVLVGHDSWVRGVSFQPLGKYVVSVSEDKTIKMWDLNSPDRPVRSFSAHKHFCTCLDVHKSLAVVATGSVDSEIAVWLAAPRITNGKEE